LKIRRNSMLAFLGCATWFALVATSAAAPVVAPATADELKEVSDAELKVRFTTAVSEASKRDDCDVLIPDARTSASIPNPRRGDRGCAL
jgi:hypothetical protein